MCLHLNREGGVVVARNRIIPNEKWTNTFGRYYKNRKKSAQKRDIGSYLAKFRAHIYSLYITFTDPPPPKRLKCLFLFSDRDEVNGNISCFARAK